MNNKRCFEALNRTLVDILPQTNTTHDIQLFGGKTLLLGGDFHQILPVIPGASKADIVDAL